MPLRADRTDLSSISSLRALFLQELNAQVRYDACHARGWTDSYLLRVDGEAVGYASIKGREIDDRDTIFECFVIPPFRKTSHALFRMLIEESAAQFVECQTNDRALTSLLYEFCTDVSADVVLFADEVVTEHAMPGAVCRRRSDDDTIFAHTVEPVGEFVLEVGHDIVATGGFLLQYNVPFADLYMEVREDQRRRGFATFLLQEVKKQCYLAGRVPAARTSVRNSGSRGALKSAGLRECAFMLAGRLAPLGA